MTEHESSAAPRRHFIQQIIDADNAAGKWNGRVQTRFPPEPNGFLHIGHAKSICLNFGLAEEFGGGCNLRFDDTNPVREEDEYVRSIIEDVRWLGFRWPGAREADPRAGVLFASDYFELIYQCAVRLVQAGKAYVDDLTPEQIREYRGSLTQPGRESPHRARTIEENLDLFARMRKGEFPDGSRTLRAKIDMRSPNLNLRDPIMYRILHAKHHRTGDAWPIYPMYDWAHGLEDSLEGITHSICTLEFENHRPLYDWFLANLTDDSGRPLHHPQQIEFARLNLNYTVMSKRRLRDMVEGGHVRGWDDPRMPTIAGLRRRGYTPEAIREFCARIGVARFDGVSDIALLEFCVRQDLNARAPRVMGVLRPLKIVIENYPEGQVESLPAINNPEDESAGTREVPFSRELFIERDDFMEDPPRKFFRLGPGREVRLRYAYFITCKEVIKDASGEIVELRCEYDPATRGGDAPDGRKVKATLHWVSAAAAKPCEVRLYDRLFSTEDPDETPEGGSFLDNLNPASLEVIDNAWIEPNWNSVDAGMWGDGIARVQFERLGYFAVDPDGTGEKPVFNRAVSLKDAWVKAKKNN